jgi:hypothetical protein
VLTGPLCVQLDINARRWRHAGPGRGWNDPDMLEVTDDRLSGCLCFGMVNQMILCRIKDKASLDDPCCLLAWGPTPISLSTVAPNPRPVPMPTVLGGER